MPTGLCTVEWLDDRSIEFTYRGDLTRAELERVVEEYFKLRTVRKEKFTIVNTLDVTKVDPSIGEVLGVVIGAFKEGGGTHVIMVATEAFVSMLGRSMGFSGGIQMKMCPDAAAGRAALAALKTDSSAS